MMLDPNLENAYTCKKKSSLLLEKDFFGGCGLSTKVVFQVLKKKGLLFFSCPHYDNDYYHIYILCITERNRKKLKIPKLPYENNLGIIQRWYGEEVDIEEYMLEELDFLRFGLNNEDAVSGFNHRDIEYILSFTHNFSFIIRSASKSLVYEFLDTIKDLHSFYLNQTIKCPYFNNTVYEYLIKYKRVELVSSKKEQGTSIVYNTNGYDSFHPDYNASTYKARIYKHGEKKFFSNQLLKKGEPKRKIEIGTIDSNEYDPDNGMDIYYFFYWLWNFNPLFLLIQPKSIALAEVDRSLLNNEKIKTSSIGENHFIIGSEKVVDQLTSDKSFLDLLNICRVKIEIPYRIRSKISLFPMNGDDSYEYYEEYEELIDIMKKYV
jgi:hypothetical protein